MICLNLTFADLDNLAAGRVGRVEVSCPSAKTGSAQTRGLRIDRHRNDFIAFMCRRCGVSGFATARAGVVQS